MTMLQDPSSDTNDSQWTAATRETSPSRPLAALPTYLPRRLRSRWALLAGACAVAIALTASVVAINQGATKARSAKRVGALSSVPSAAELLSGSSGASDSPSGASGTAATAPGAARPLPPTSYPPVSASALTVPATTPPPTVPSFVGQPANYNEPIDACAFFADAQLAASLGWSAPVGRNANGGRGSCGVEQQGGTETLAWYVQPASSPVIATMVSGGWGPTEQIPGVGDRATLVRQNTLGILVVIRHNRALVLQLAADESARRTNSLKALGGIGAQAL